MMITESFYVQKKSHHLHSDVKLTFIKPICAPSSVAFVNRVPEPASAMMVGFDLKE